MPLIKAPDHNSLEPSGTALRLGAKMKKLGLRKCKKLKDLGKMQKTNSRENPIAFSMAFNLLIYKYLLFELERSYLFYLPL